jgi:hypothetical protein
VGSGWSIIASTKEIWVAKYEIMSSAYDRCPKDRAIKHIADVHLKPEPDPLRPKTYSGQELAAMEAARDKFEVVRNGRLMRATFEPCPACGERGAKMTTA